MGCDEIRENLLAYLDGELAEPERAEVEAHLKTCDACAAELARLQALQADLWDAIPAGLEPLRLSNDASARIQARLDRARGRRVRGRLLRLRPAFVKVAIPVLTLIAIVVVGLVGRPPPAVRALETIVVVPQTLAPDTDAALRVIVRREGTAAPVADAELEVHLRAAGGEAVPLYRGRTGSAGSADVRFRVPGSGADRLSADLIVTARSPLGEGRVVRPVEIRRSYRLYLGSDKPLYRPGQTIHLRVLALDAGRNAPAAERAVRLAVLDPEGRALFEQAARTSAYGIASADYTLGAGAAHGEYRLAVELGDTRSERTVTVGDYQRPPFRVELDLDRPYYLAGETVEGQVSASQLDGAPLGGAGVLVRATLHNPERSLVATLQGRADAGGLYRFRFSLPADLGTSDANPDAQLALEARVTDALGRGSWSGRVVPVADTPLTVDVVAEGGRLRPGIENQVYLLVSTPDGAPVRAQVEIEAGGERRTLSTDAYGLATWSLTPEPGARELRVVVTARDEQGRSVRRRLTLSADRGPAQVLLRLDRAAYRVGESIHVDLLAGQGEVVYLDVLLRDQGQAVSTQVAQLEGGRARLAVDVSPQMVGTLELHAYQVLPDGALARDARVAVVEPASSLAVELRAGQASYRPGEGAQVVVSTALEGRPAQSALGIAVVDESIHALAERAPGFAGLFFALKQEPFPAPGASEAQQRAARAAWAGLPAGEVELARSGPAETAGEEAAQRRTRAAGLAWGLSGALLVLALGLWLVTLARLRAVRERRATLWRTFWLTVALAVCILLPLTAFLILGAWSLLGGAASRGLLVILLAAWLADLIVLGLLSVRQRDDGGQICVLLVAAYGVLALLLGQLAARVDLGPVLAALALLSWAGVWGALLVWSAVLRFQGRRALAAAMLALMALAVALAVLAGALLRPEWILARTATDPLLYAGPLGWLTGCSPVREAPELTREIGKESLGVETVEVEKEVEKVKETVVVEKEVEATQLVEVTREVEKEGTKLVTEPGAPQATPTLAADIQRETPRPTSPLAALPTPTPAALPTSTPAPAAERPFSLTVQPAPSPEPLLPLLGQVAAETIYWVPEAVTDAQGQLVIEFSLPDVPAAWRMTVLASTMGGELGEAELLLPVNP